MPLPMSCKLFAYSLEKDGQRCVGHRKRNEMTIMLTEAKEYVCELKKLQKLENKEN